MEKNRRHCEVLGEGSRIKCNDASRNCPYKNIFDVATKVMSIPHSNADIERVFSLMNVVKTKLRNSLHLKTTNAILLIRTRLIAANSNCHEYKLPTDVIKKIGSSEKYKLNEFYNSDSAGPSSSDIMDADLNMNLDG
ncbi:unnamed protein product [Euphydryas editha]|uniref:HAT C-terminal dimerisation domain-containing protein n=1 Tax=Euphydryas editha TaxID=104508 RepID=A0AAU9TRZ5_EUPED|nr:unnamed protein product [Euphydryas editha]